MMQLSFKDMIGNVFKTLTSSPIFIVITIAFVGLFLACSSQKLNQSHKKKLIIGMFSILLLCLTLGFGNVFFQMIDQLINQLAITIFFPSMAYYLIIVLITNIIAIRTILKDSKHLYVKKINLGMFCFINLLLFVILMQISKQNINVYSQISLYQNQEILSFIELSMILFTFWMLTLGIVACIDKLTVKTEEVVQEQTVEAVEPVVIEQPKVLVTDIPNVSYTFEESPIDYNSYLNTYPNRLFDNNEAMISETQDQMKEQVVSRIKEKEFLTLEDYRNLLSLLKSMRDEDNGNQKARDYYLNEEMQLQEMLFNSLNLGKSL